MAMYKYGANIQQKYLYIDYIKTQKVSIASKSLKYSYYKGNFVSYHIVVFGLQLYMFELELNIKRATLLFLHIHGSRKTLMTDQISTTKHFSNK